MIHISKLPLLTVGVLSWNRLHYLRATLESAYRCISYPNIQWIIVDNYSTEPGLADYLKSLPWISDLIFLKSDHVTAMNEVVSRARGDILLMWPDDVQFIVEGNWMQDCIEVLMYNDWIGSMGLNSLRRSTIQRIWGKRISSLADGRAAWSDVKRYGMHFRFQRKITSRGGFPFYTYGWKEDGVVGSGIPSLTRMDVWKKLGPWKATSDGNIIDSSRGGESEMLNRWRRMNIPWQRALPVLPVSADILTDPTGTKAKVRGSYRYGVYSPPKDGHYYYQIYSQAECEERLKSSLPIPFEEIVIPVGFELPMDPKGNLLKASLNTTVKTSVIE